MPLNMSASLNGRPLLFKVLKILNAFSCSSHFINKIFKRPLSSINILQKGSNKTCGMLSIFSKKKRKFSAYLLFDFLSSKYSWSKILSKISLSTCVDTSLFNFLFEKSNTSLHSSNAQMHLPKFLAQPFDTSLVFSYKALYKSVNVVSRCCPSMTSNSLFSF